MDNGALLAALKIDLGITAIAYDDRLTQYIEHAKQQIEREGCTLEDSDSELVVMYAAWLWRRRDSGDGMPRMLRYLLNNRIFSEKMTDE